MTAPDRPSPRCTAFLAALSLSLLASSMPAQEAAEETDDLPETVVSAPSAAPAPRAPVQFRSAPRTTTAAAEPEPLVLNDAVPERAVGAAGATFLPATGLELLGVREPQDVVRYAANQHATDSGSRSFGDVYSVRGLTNTVFFGAPSTTIYVDDIPFGETFTYAQNLGPIRDIEVLRGPQPTRVGRSVYGGLINVTTRRPGDELELSANYRYGSFERHGFDAFAMGPIGDRASFRFGGGFERHEGFLVNPLTGQRVDHQESLYFDGAVYAEIAPDWELGLIAGYNEQRDGAPRLTSLDRTTGFYTVASDIAGEQFRSTNHQAVRLYHENERFKFLSVTAHRGFDLDPYTIDLDFTPLPIGFTSLSQSQEFWSQEFRFSDNDPNADWGWNAGLFGSTSRIQGVGLRGLNLQQSETRNTVTRINQPIPFPPFSIPLTVRSVSQLETDVALEQLTVHTIDEETFAVYGGTEYRGIDGFTLRGGARLDWVRRSIVRDKSQTGSATTLATTTSTIDPVPPFPPFPAPPVDVRTIATPLDAAQRRLNFQDEWVHVTPTLGADWEVSDSSVLYANTAYAFKPGGFTAYADDARFVPFDEEKAWTIETGVRSDWLDGRLQTNLLGYYSAVRDYQVERSFTPTDFAVFNADRAEIFGVEFETAYALTDTLSFVGSIGYTNARLTQYVDPVTGRDLSGATAPFVPEFDAIAALDYQLENGFFARIELQALGNVSFDDFNRADFGQRAYSLLNSMVGYRKDGRTLALYGTNLGETEYYTNMNPEVRTGAVGAPREFGVRVGVDF